jgi:hypothetical protein
MIKFDGDAQPDRLFRLVGHHARGIEHLVAPIAVVLLDALGRTHDEHVIRARKGWNSVDLHLANGDRIAFRARKTNGHYDHLNVHRGGINPLGPLQFEIREAADVRRLHRLLRGWVSQG